MLNAWVIAAVLASYALASEVFALAQVASTP